MMTNSRMTNLGWPPLTNFSNHRIISERILCLLLVDFEVPLSPVKSPHVMNPSQRYTYLTGVIGDGLNPLKTTGNYKV